MNGHPARRTASGPCFRPTVAAVNIYSPWRRSVKLALSRILIVAALCLSTGCAWLDYQETKLHSGSRYLPVDAETHNFGYQRLMINCRLRDSLNTFVETHGYPDFIYEYNKGAMNGIRLYYLDKNQVDSFLESGSSPNSAELVEQRELTSFEKAEIKELQERQPLF
jgi:hypothetical protein